MATRRCCVCVHPQRTKIEALIAGGQAQSAVAKTFSLDRSQLSRHMSGGPKSEPHVTPQEMSAYICGTSQVEELRLIAARQGGTVIEDLTLAKAMAFKMLHDAATAQDASRFATLAGRFIDTVEALARATGQLGQLNPAILIDARQQVSIVASPEFARLQRGLVRFCLAHPEMRGEIAAMLSECEAENGRSDLIELEAPRAA